MGDYTYTCLKSDFTSSYKSKTGCNSGDTEVKRESAPSNSPEKPASTDSPKTPPAKVKPANAKAKKDDPKKTVSKPLSPPSPPEKPTETASQEILPQKVEANPTNATVANTATTPEAEPEKAVAAKDQNTPTNALQTQDQLTKLFLGIKADESKWREAAKDHSFTDEELNNLGVTDEKLRKALKDAKLTQEEAKTFGISERLFRLILNNMDALGVTSNGEIDITRLQEATAVIQEYANLLGISFEKALEAYKNSRSFRNVNLSELRDSKGEIAGWLSGVTNWNAENVGKTLEGKIHTSLINLVKTKIADLKTSNDVAAYLLRCAMASMTGMWGKDKPFGVEEVKEISSYNPKNVTKKNLLKWWETGKVEEEEGEFSSKKVKGTLTEGETKKLRELKARGNTENLITSLKKLRDKYRMDIAIREFLAQEFENLKEYENALEDALFVYDKQRTDDREKTILRLAENYAQTIELTESTADQRALAGKVHDQLEKILHEKYLTNYQRSYKDEKAFMKLVKEGKEGDKYIQLCYYLADKYKELKEKPLPGQLALKTILSNKTKKASEIKEAYEAFATQLEAAKDKESDPRKLTRIYIKLAEIEQIKGNLDKVKEYTLAALDQYSKLGTEDELKEDILESAEHIVKQLYDFKTKPFGKSSKQMLSIAKKLFEKYEEINPKGKIELSDGTELKTEAFSKKEKDAKEIKDIDELQTYLFQLGSNADSVAKGEKGALDLEQTRHRALTALYLLDKCKSEKNFGKEMERWAKEIQKETKYDGDNLLNPVGKVKDYISSKNYINYLASRYGKTSES